jgi:UDP-2,3-diacylglucosamine pyrophosphatase LpxH
VSDLHIGDRSPKDNLRRAGRDVLLECFLDYVGQREGHLIILGDFFELHRYPLGSIIRRRGELLDRLAAMDTVYVPGNHDEEVFEQIDPSNPPHPFFAGMSSAFTRSIGNKRFRFMHGHEVDPLVNAGTRNLGRMIGAMAYRFELRRDGGLVCNNLRTDTAQAPGDPALRLRTRLKDGVSKTLRESCLTTSAERVTVLTRRIRTRHMIWRYGEDRTGDLYDVAIVGHTHHAAAFGDWFFNSGSWTGRTNNFLVISPDGRVGVFDWSHHGPAVHGNPLAA